MIVVPTQRVPARLQRASREHVLREKKMNINTLRRIVGSPQEPCWKLVHVIDPFTANPCAGLHVAYLKRLLEPGISHALHTIFVKVVSN